MAILSKDVTNIFGYQVSNGSIKKNIALARKLIALKRYGHFLACANPHSLVVASRDEVFSKALQAADLLIPDGEGILLAGRALNLPIRQRVTGSDFFRGLTVELSQEGGARYFFLGSTEHVLRRITRRIAREFPNIEVCGTMTPPFKPEFSEDDNREMVAAVNAAQPDVLWVGMTAPKQEKWIYKNLDKLQVPLIADWRSIRLLCRDKGKISRILAKLRTGMAAEVFKGAAPALGEKPKIYSDIFLLDCQGMDKKGHIGRKV